MVGEFDIIRQCFAPLASSDAALGLSDDAALIMPPAGLALVATADAMISGVHFLPDDPPETVGRKLLRVNLSDLAAMGAAPLGYLLTCAWPKDWDQDWIAAFARGLGEDQERFGISLLGGDTTSGPGPLCLSLTALGSVAPDQVLKRSSASAGERILVSGTLGDGAFGLLVRYGRLGGLSDATLEALTQAYRLPTPRLQLGRALAQDGLAAACLDISDGLVADLGHICEASGLGARIHAESIPLSPAVQEAVAMDLESFPLALTGGDDYELCFTVAADQVGRVKALSQTLGLPLTEIGEMVQGEGVAVLDRDGAVLALDHPGWTHF
ncbi:MAG: thiamine-phosphate kinase [Kiloniellales bacterium]